MRYKELVEIRDRMLVSVNQRLRVGSLSFDDQRIESARLALVYNYVERAIMDERDDIQARGR